MTGGPRIIPIEPGQPATGPAEGILDLAGAEENAAQDESGWLEDAAEVAPLRDYSWLAPAITGLLVTGWTGFFIWANFDAMSVGGTPLEWSQWIVAWSVPALLCLVALLVVLRTSRREALRFADVARSLNEESRQLEQRLRLVNGELSLARDFIAAQSRDLESLGRIATDRLSGSASQLADLISDNGKRVDSIASVAHSALENMEKLRSQLPVIANAAKDVTNNIGNAGRTAHVQLESMVAGLQRLNEFGVASERQVETIREAVAAAIEELARQADQLGEIVRVRYSELTSEGEIHRQLLDQDEIAALAAIRARAAALSEELATHRLAAETAENEALEALRARLTTLREESARISSDIATGESRAISAWTDRAANHASALRDALSALDHDHRQAVEAGSARFARFAEDAAALTVRLRGELDDLEQEIAQRRSASDSDAETRAEALRERLAEIDAEIAERREAAEMLLVQSAENVGTRLNELEQVVEQQQFTQLARAREVAANCTQISERVEAFSALLAQSALVGEEAGQKVAAALAVLNDSLMASRDTLSGTDHQIADLTNASVRLLELIQASSDHARAQIPAALNAAEEGLRGIEDRISGLRSALTEAGDLGRIVSDHVASAHRQTGTAMEDLARLQGDIGTRTAAQDQQIATLRNRLAGVREESAALAGEVESSLNQAITRLTEAARMAGTEIGSGAKEQIGALAGKLAHDSKAALAEVIEVQAVELAGVIDRTVARAAEKSRDAAMQLRDQLAKVDELAGNLENRVAQARERAQEQVDSDFARRVALITESLNSTSIDIAKVLSTDVADTAWAAYLRGDRGIFTRRAVSLLDSGEAKAVLHHYERDSEFRAHVNHYIHDFEAMLRQLLSTRDGNALGVTLLSSDMGKLYVALAQAIERLRT